MPRKPKVLHERVVVPYFDGTNSKAVQRAFMHNYNLLDPVAKGQFKYKFPSVMWRPNRAQKRPISRWYKAPYPRTHVITFGNRTGKTEWLAEFLCGAAKGNAFVNPAYFQSPFFDELNEKRMDGTLTIWWVCNADMMKMKAPNYKLIQKHIPDCKFKNKTNNGVYREIHIPALGRDGKDTTIVVQVKTHDQESLAYAGENVDLFICDEPPPQEHWDEMSARMVNLAGDVGGRVVIGGTPLKAGAFLLDLIENAQETGDGDVVHDEGSIWENCAGEELPDEIALKYGIEKDPETGVYDTDGFLSREGIENAIKNWEKGGDPDALSARIDGKFTHVQGRIYKVWNRDVHIIDEYPIPEKYPIIMVCDPHDTRPDCVGWFMVTPRNKLIAIAEYPLVPYELCLNRAETIPQTCDAWRMIEGDLGISGRVHYFGDPLAMMDPDPYTGKTKKQLYADNGYNFSVNVNNKIEYGHEKVREFLYYDKVMFEQFREDPLYQPRFMAFRRCRNISTFMLKYGTKIVKDPTKPVSEKPDEKWKDFADIVRYAVNVFKPFDSWINGRNGGVDSEWARVKAARAGHMLPPNSRFVSRNYMDKLPTGTYA